MRVVAVTIGLIFAGAVTGALVAILTVTAVVYATGGPGEAGPMSTVLRLVGTVGALLGAPLAPAVAWLLLRRVPIGRAFTGLALGGILGCLVGWLLPNPFASFVQPIVAGALGFCIAGVILRRTASTEASPDAT